MKDPLQKQPTPYEILKVTRGATASEIDKAFKFALVARGANVQKLTGAKVTLERPVDRAILDLLHYDDATLARLDPNPLTAPALDAAHRADTAASWEAQLRRNFPDYSVVHALAVLWYWWAVSVSESSTPDPLLRDLWTNAITYLAPVIASDDFRPEFVPADLLPKVKTALNERIAADIHRFAQVAGPQEETFANLELLLKNEVRTARALAAADIRANRGRLCCGALLLNRVGIITKIRQQIANAIEVRPDQPALIALQDALSPFSAIASLIEGKQYQDAIDAIAKLRPQDRDAAEVRALESRALFERGKQEATLGNLDAALDLWTEAHTKAATEEAKRAIHDEIVNTVRTKAAAMQSRQPNEAIALLDRALTIVTSQNLSLTLAEILTSRGIATILDAQKKQDSAPLADTIKAIENGLVDLDRAAKLGSKRAEEQAVVARNILASLKGGMVFVDMPPTARGPLDEAARAAEREDWTAAIAALRRALNQTSHGSQASTTIKKHLATMLTNRAIGNVNKAMARVQGQQQNAADLQLLVAALGSARKDLREAKNFDPDSAHVRDNLRQVEQWITELGPVAGMVRDVDMPPDFAPNPFDDIMFRQQPPPKPVREGRHPIHSWFVGFLLFMAVVLAASTSTPGKWTPKWSIAFDQWLVAVGHFSTMGKIGFFIGRAIGWPITIALIVVAIFAAPIGYLISVVCATRWKKKDPFAKWVEIAVWIYAITFTIGILQYRGPSVPRVPRVSQVSQVSQASRGTEEPRNPRNSKIDWESADVSAAGIVTTLRTISAFPKEQAQRAATEIASALECVPAAARPALLFCLASAHERGGDVAHAKQAYELVAASAPPPLKTSAEFRLSALQDSDPKVLEARYQSMRNAAAADGLFVIGGTWASTDTQHAALQGLMDLRSGQKSIRLFNWLRGKSFFPPAYAYLFILLMLALAVKVIELPFLIQGAKLSLLVPRLRGEYAQMKSRYAGDPVGFSAAVNSMYKRNGIAPAAGCLKIVIDIGFVVWVMVTLRDYAPQLALDGARFLWVSNVVERDLGILALWAVAGVLVMLAMPQLEQHQTGQLIFGSVILLGIVAGVAWYWSWPAYLMIFWTVLSALTLVVHFLTIGVLATRS